MTRRVLVLGSTGSIGEQALEIIREHPADFSLVGLAVGANAARAQEQGAEFGLRKEQVAVGVEATVELIERNPADVILNGIAGAAGLLPTLAALRTDAKLALANKESLIIGGQLVLSAASPQQLVPVDSEHSALAQCLRSGTTEEVKQLWLTASGGPFRGFTRSQLQGVKPEQALRHPTWNMGPLVTTNSATLVNKGLELIEAHLLFGVPIADIRVVVHPQSIVHSMVEFRDGSIIAQASPPNMKLPIALGLSWPHRIADAAPALDFSTAAEWKFEPLDESVFDAVALARKAAELGGTFPAVYNGANEAAVAAFHAGEISFVAITEIIARVMQQHESQELTLEGILEADRSARAQADSEIHSAGFGVAGK